MVFIDETLSQRRQSKDELATLLALYDVRRMNAAEFSELQRHIGESEGFDPELLLEVYLESEDAVEQTALFLLESLGGATLVHRMNYFLGNPRIPKNDQKKLLLLKALLLQKDGQAEAWLRETSLSDFVDVSAKLWECLEPEELGMIWLQDYFSMPPAEKEPILRLFCESHKACYLGILALEAQKGVAAVVEMIARAAAAWNSLDALPLLERLARSPHRRARVLAGGGLAQIRSGGGESLIKSHLYASHQHFQCFHGYHGRDADSSPQYVLYSTINAKKVIKVVMVALRPDGTIQRCLAEVRPTRKSFDEMVGNLQGEFPDIFFEPVEPARAMQLIYDAEDRSLTAGAPIPADYWVWSILIPPRATLGT